MATQPYPRVLHVDTTLAAEHTFKSVLWDDKIDYRIYKQVSPAWRKIEQKLRMDITLARHAIRLSKDFDVLLCGSEKVGIPISLLGSPKPVATVIHNLVPRRKAQLVQWLGATKGWAKVGVYTKADAEFMVNRFGYKHENIFNYVSAPLDEFAPAPLLTEGVILSAGASSRDYPTLVAALKELPGCHTEIYASSQYQDPYRGGTADQIPAWVQFMPDTPHSQITQRITQQARFVVVPIAHTTQYGAGSTALLEASAAGKAVIATRTLGTVDYVQDGITGFLVPPGDSVALRDAIRKLWEDPHLAHRMGQAGHAFVEENYNQQRVEAGIRQALIAAHNHL